MKRILALLLAALLLAGLFACTKSAPAEEAKTAEAQKPAEETLDGPNAVCPLTEYSSLDEINSIVGTALVHPGVMGVTGERFFVIDCGEYKIARYDFTVNGVEYELRASPVTNDISGYHMGERTAFPDGGHDGISYAESDTDVLAQWFNIAGQHVLRAKGKPENFKAVAEEMCEITTPGMKQADIDFFYKDHIGQYYDSYSQRAMLLVEDNGGDGLRMTVTWSNSASEYVEWTMTARLYEDGLLSYKDGVKKTIKTDAGGTEEVTIEATDQEGCFSPDGEKLLWSGAPEESCRNCCFERAVD